MSCDSSWGPQITLIKSGCSSSGLNVAMVCRDGVGSPADASMMSVAMVCSDAIGPPADAGMVNVAMVCRHGVGHTHASH